jgi:hypothetical protein
MTAEKEAAAVKETPAAANKETPPAPQSLADAQEDHLGKLLSNAIDNALTNARGWDSEEAKQEYIDGLLDDDFLPPIFCESQEELQKSGMTEAFSSLLFEEPPATYVKDFKTQGNTNFALGKKSQASNKQYYRDAVRDYHQALIWADRVELVEEDFVKPTEGKESEYDYYTAAQILEVKSTLYANAAMAHLQIKNAGHARDACRKSLKENPLNLKAHYRLAKALQLLQHWAEAGDAIDEGLNACPKSTSTPEGEENSKISISIEEKELLKLQKMLEHCVRRARQQQQRRRAERVSKVKEVRKHCKAESIHLGRVALVSRVSDEDDDDSGREGDAEQNAWHHHHPHTPCMCVYPSHH